MKKGKYIDYNILMACLSKKPGQATKPNLQQEKKKDIVDEFYEALGAQSSWYPSKRLKEESLS